MAELRTGKYGQYYGSVWGTSKALTQAQMETNARYIYSYLTDKGWTLNAIAGVLGNMQNESAMNPGRWEGNDVGNGPGYGLVQWTPYTKYTEWCTSNGYSDPSTMDANLARIIYELDNGIQYYKNNYPYTFKTFVKSTDSPYTLACAFAFDYERSWTSLYGTEAEKEALRQLRGGCANSWYSFLSGETPTPPVNPDPDEPDEPDTPTWKPIKQKKLSLLLLLASTRRRVR